MVRNFEVTTISLRKEEKDYVRVKKMKLSSFIRQAIQAHKEGKFDYNYL